MKVITVGDFQVTFDAEGASRSGATISGRPCRGRAQLATVTGPSGLHLRVADVQWDNGEREVRAEKRLDSPERYDRLVERLRMGVRASPSGDAWMEMSQARIKAGDRPGLVRATMAELDEGAGVCVRDVMLRHGAADFGLRADVLEDTSRRRSYLCTAFPPESKVVPILAFVLTRVAPVVRGMQEDGRVAITEVTNG